jgi:flagellar basal body-associated protein FliL
MIELRQAVNERKKEIKSILRESISKDRRYMLNTNTAKDKEMMIKSVKHE